MRVFWGVDSNLALGLQQSCIIFGQSTADHVREAGPARHRRQRHNVITLAVLDGARDILATMHALTDEQTGHQNRSADAGELLINKRALLEVTRGNTGKFVHRLDCSGNGFSCIARCAIMF